MAVRKDMRVNVVQRDIDRGERKSSISCPIARAIMRKRNVGAVVVGSYGIEVYDLESEMTHYRMTWEGKCFMNSFDHGEKVEPRVFKFRLD